MLKKRWGGRAARKNLRAEVEFLAPFGIKITLDYRQKKSGKMLDIIAVFREEKNIPDFVVLLKITLLW